MVGRNIRRLREERQEASQDEMAEILRSFGLSWNRSQLAKAERGERSFTLEQLFLLANALDATLAELVALEPDERVALTDEATADQIYLHASLAGDRYIGNREPVVALPHLDAPVTLWWEQVVAPANMLMRSSKGRMPTETEWRIAEVFGIATRDDFQDIATAALELWGRSLLDERDARVDAELLDKPDASLTALRGHATRALTAELRPVLDRRRAKRRRK